jgi:hypothetical protein
MAYNSFFRAWRKEKKKTKNTLIDFIGMYFQSQWVCESLHQCFFLNVSNLYQRDLERHSLNGYLGKKKKKKCDVRGYFAITNV